MDELIDGFRARAAALGVRVEHLPDSAEAASTIAAIWREETGDDRGRPLLGASELIEAAPELTAALARVGIVVAPGGDPATTRDAPLGLSLARLAVAETGSVLLAERSLADRGIGMLVVTQIVLCPTAALVTSLDEAAPVLRSVAEREGGGYATLVTGPSRTADIERVLTVGVQGPARLAVLFVDRLA